MNKPIERAQKPRRKEDRRGAPKKERRDKAGESFPRQPVSGGENNKVGCNAAMFYDINIPYFRGNRKAILLIFHGYRDII